MAVITLLALPLANWKLRRRQPYHISLNIQ